MKELKPRPTGLCPVEGLGMGLAAALREDQGAAAADRAHALGDGRGVIVTQG